MLIRPSARGEKELRPIQIRRQYLDFAEGSVLIAYGQTKIICSASILPGVPRFLKGTGQGWITAEYAMLPRATLDRTQREAVIGKQSARSQEIQRLIGRALRNCVDRSLMGEYSIYLDCDVIQADGGTRTASITGACIALYDAIETLKRQKKITSPLWKQWVASVSVGLYKGHPVLDLDYKEDAAADVDLNVVMDEKEQLIELQGTGERRAFDETELSHMLGFAKHGIRQLISKQKAVVEA